MSSKRGKEHRALLDKLSSVLTEKTKAATANRMSLRDAVCEFVAAEKAIGVPLEGVIQAVKDILRKAEQSASSASDELAQQLIDWCVEFHRRADALLPKPRGLVS